MQRFGATPSPQQLDEYMIDLGLRRNIIGKSLQGRDLVLYDFPERSENKETVLFLSLVHGNEPMGLISLMTTAHILAEGSTRLRGGGYPVNIFFLPIVNVDGYLRNIECSSELHRGNMRDTGCQKSALTSKCKDLVQDTAIVGVDLNRNFPTDWNGTYSEAVAVDVCSNTYHGSAPFSEPETMAIRKLAQEHNIVAALSFHSLSSKSRGKGMLIHPYASSRPLHHMPDEDVGKFRRWARELNSNNLFLVGTASETIDYTAGGTTIDWLYDVHNVTAFVFEVVPVCDSRWCPATPRLYRSARDNGNVGRRFVELAVHGRVVQDVHSIQRSIAFMMFVAIVWMAWTWKMSLASFLRRRIYGKFKDVSLRETEMKSLRQS